jgi:signal transduction histidine kinase
MTNTPYETGDQFLARVAAQREQFAAELTHFIATPERFVRMASPTLWRIAMMTPMPTGGR